MALSDCGACGKRQVIHKGGGLTQRSWSPRGNPLTYAFDPAGVLQPVGCAGPVIPAGGVVFDLASPDGLWIFTARAAGGNEKFGYAEVSQPSGPVWTLRYDPKAYPYPKLASDGYPYPLLWSASGKTLYYTLQPNLEGRRFASLYYSGANLYSLDLETGETGQVLKGRLMAVAVLPDEKIIAYTKYDDFPRCSRPDHPGYEGGKPRSAAPGMDDLRAGSLMWSPDGSRLVLAANTRDDQTVLLLARFKEKKIELERIVEDEPRTLLPVAWTEAERALLYDPDNQIAYWLVLDGAQIVPAPAGTYTPASP